MGLWCKGLLNDVFIEINVVHYNTLSNDKCLKTNLFMHAHKKSQLNIANHMKFD